MSAIDVHVTGGGVISNGEMKIDSTTTARCAATGAPAMADCSASRPSACARP